ncbi:MAG: hypothetical protein RL213_1918 [Bacteroidota bacterium]|jgi:hypothetical protein
MILLKLYPMIRKLLIAILPLSLWAVLSADTMSSTGIAGRTGSPGETNCTSCHTSFPLNSAGGSVTLNNPNMPGNVYTPGQTYSMSLTVARTGVNLFGFGLEALNAAGQNAGTLNVTDAASTQIKNATVTGISRRNLVHTAGGGSGAGSKTFNFSWTAPAIGTGTVTFYFAGNCVNGNTLSSGDYVYTGSLSLTEAPCNVPSTPSAITGTTVYCAGSSAVLSVAADPSATGYTWTLPAGWIGSSNTNSIAVIAGSASGTVSVTANNACGNSPASSLSVSSTTVTVTGGSANITCYGASNGTAQVTAAGGNSPYTYQWSNNVTGTNAVSGLSAGSYVVLVTDAGGCSASRSFTITEPAALLASAGPAQTACAGSTVTLGGGPTATGGTVPYSYLWSNGSGSTYATANPSFAASVTSSWLLTVTDANGCTAGGNVTVNVNPLPPQPIITFVNDTLVSSSSAYNQWYLNGTSISGATAPFFLPSVNGDYTVTVTDPFSGCSSTSSIYTYLSTYIPSENLLEKPEVFPVPADQFVTVDLRKPDSSRTVSIFDMTGKIVYTGVVQTATFSIPTVSLPAGFYTLLIGNERLIFTVNR